MIEYDRNQAVQEHEQDMISNCI